MALGVAGALAHMVGSNAAASFLREAADATTATSADRHAANVGRFA